MFPTSVARSAAMALAANFYLAMPYHAYAQSVARKAPNLFDTRRLGRARSDGDSYDISDSTHIADCSKNWVRGKRLEFN